LLVISTRTASKPTTSTLMLYLCGTRVTIIALVAVGLLFLLQTYRLSMLKNWRIAPDRDPRAQRR
jgi:hypothetical protein